MIRRILVAVIAAVAFHSAGAFASDIGSQFADEDLIIVWDGGKDVFPAKGNEGRTTVLGALGIVDYANYAVRATFTPRSTDPPPVKPTIRFIRLLLYSEGLSTACAANVT